MKSVWRCSSTRLGVALLDAIESFADLLDALPYRDLVGTDVLEVFAGSAARSSRVSCSSRLSCSTSLWDLAMDLVSSAWRSLAAAIWSLRLAASTGGAGTHGEREGDHEDEDEQTEPGHGGPLCSRVHARHIDIQLPLAAVTQRPGHGGGPTFTASVVADMLLPLARPSQTLRDAQRPDSTFEPVRPDNATGRLSAMDESTHGTTLPASGPMRR